MLEEDGEPVRERLVRLSRHYDAASSWQSMIDQTNGNTCVSTRVPLPFVASYLTLSSILKVWWWRK